MLRALCAGAFAVLIAGCTTETRTVSPLPSGPVAVPAADNGQPSDSATPAADNGQPSDSATPTADNGQPSDSATPTADNGQPSDSATPTADSGQPSDSATPTADSGQPSDSATPRGNTPTAPGAGADAPCFREAWYKNGQKRMEGGCICTYLNGACTGGYPDGLQTMWHPNGQKMSESYLDDYMLTGLSRTWDETGNLTACTCYDNATPITSGGGGWTLSGDELSQCETKPCPDPQGAP